MRPSSRYPGLRVEQLGNGTYAVTDRAGESWLVYSDLSVHIGNAARWRAVHRGRSTTLIAPTKDALMRHIAGGAADAIRIVA